MKLQLQKNDHLNTVTAYGDDYVSINGIRHGGNLAILPDRLYPQWTSATFETLTLADFDWLAALDAEIILLGTGKSLRFPRAELLQPLVRAQKGLEVMDLPAFAHQDVVRPAGGRQVHHF